ncbi:MAG TPA: zinc-binding dehydrogenase [Phototrophicaceae bacterium]|nr:zinc-binding dehydrogenase [Phototrophicaceae bacterium]
MRIIRIHQFGSPDVLKVEEAEAPHAETGQVVIAVEAVGVAFGDVIVRSGKFPVPLPHRPGFEVGGRVIEIGASVDATLLGQAVVAQTNHNQGGYAEQAVADVASLTLVPDGLSVQQAVAVYLQGKTAVHLTKAMNVKAGESALVTAAAGSLGSLLVQLVKSAGAGIVIGAARGQRKLDFIRQLGADAAVDYSASDWPEQVRKLTDGAGVAVALDAVGGTIALQAFQALANGRGRLGVYGFASGAYATFDTGELTRRGLTLLGPLGIAFARPEADQRADAAFALSEAAAGRLKVTIGQTYPLERAADAHAALETRQTIGKVLLIP